MANKKASIDEINEAILMGINIGVAAGLSMNNSVDNGIKIYEHIVNKFTFANSNIIDQYIEVERGKAQKMFDRKQWRKALARYQDLFDSARMNEDEFIKMISILSELKQNEIAIEYLKKYEALSDNKIRASYVVGDLLYFKFNQMEEAIKYFEYYIKHRPNDALVWNSLGHIHATLYKDKYLDKQLKYFLNAYNLNPNSKIFTKNVAIIYSKLFDYENAKKYYEHLLKINPTHDDFFDYACLLIQSGDFKKGYKYLRHRFNKENNCALYPPMLSPDKKLQTKSQIKGSKILVQCEQGYGDSIMYSRFIKELRKSAEKVIFVVQNDLVSLFESSDIADEVIKLDVDFSTLDFDYHVPLMDLPFILGTTTKNLPHKDKYLTVDEKKIYHFKQEYLNNNKKLKIGLAFEGHFKSEDLNRDIPLVEFEKLFKDKNIDVYILQHDDTKKQIENLDSDYKFINIGKDFATFEDTAAAIECMDLILTSDNVILNLAGALGKKTYGIFNKFVEYRWFKLDNNTGWYNSVKPFQNTELDKWAPTIKQAIKAIKDES